jgi:hypothetical protein
LLDHPTCSIVPQPTTPPPIRKSHTYRSGMFKFTGNYLFMFPNVACYILSRNLCLRFIIIIIITPWLWFAGELCRPSDRRLWEKLVPTFADRGCHVVSVTDPYVRILAFLDPEKLLFLSSSSSVVLTRLSGPRSRNTTSQKIW